MSTVAIGSIAAAGIGGGLSLAGSEAQAGAAENAQQLQAQEAEQALQFQEQQWNTEQANAAPFIKAGQGAVLNLSDLLSTPGKGLLASYPGGPFTAPTLAQAENYPGYQFQLQEGEKAVQNSAAAQGELLDPNAARAEAGYAENLAQTDYGNVYNQALQTYGTNYNTWNQQLTNEYNRLAGLAGAGQQATQALNTTGQQAASNTGNILLTTGAQQGQDIQNAAAATASGYTAAGNTLSGAFNNIGSTLALQQLLNPGGGGGSYFNGLTADQISAMYGGPAAAPTSTADVAGLLS